MIRKTGYLLLSLSFPAFYHLVQYGTGWLLSLLFFSGPPQNSLSAAALFVNQNFSSIGIFVAAALTLLMLQAAFRLTGRSLMTETSAAAVPRLMKGPIVICAVGCNILVGVVMILFPIPAQVMAEHTEVMQALSGTNLGLAMLGGCVAAPVIEEVVYRGLAYRYARTALPRVAAVLWSALLFGAAHGNLLQSSYAFAVGLVLAVVFEMSRSLWAAILFHMVFNFSNYFIGLFFMGDSYDQLAVTGAIGVLFVYYSLLHLWKIMRTRDPVRA